MKQALTLAVLCALAAAPAMAQQSGDPSDQSTTPRASGQMQRLGSNPDAIRGAQQALEQQGYQIGQADGVMGPKTRQALKKFQQDQGLHASGQLDQQTAQALGVPGGPQQAQTPEEHMNKNQPAAPAPQQGDENQPQQQQPNDTNR